MNPSPNFAVSPIPHDHLVEDKLRPSFSASADRRRALFVRILKREFLRDFSFLWDVASGRSTTRDPITQKILESLLSPESQSSWIGSVVKELSTPSHFAGSECRDQRMVFEISSQTEIDMSRLNLLLGVVANEALRRYESFIVDRLSDDFERSIVPFATVGARRMVEYLSHFAVVDAQKKIKINLSESLLLAGLVEGQSGAWVEGFNNQPLELKQTKKDLLGRMAPMTIDAEDVYARAGMRHIEIKESKLIDNLYIRHKSRHHDLSEWRRLQEHKKGKVHSAEFGYVRFREEKGVMQDPKAGFTVMPYAVIDRRYDFGPQESKVLSEALQAELKASTNSIIQIDRASLVRYINWSVSAKASNLVAYVREVLNYPQVKRVLCSDDLSGLDFTGLDLSHCDFSGAIFSGNLNRVNFNHSYLIGTVFKKGASAQQLSLIGAFCQYLHAEEINFQGSHFNQANFDYACLKNAKLTGCQTFGTQWAYADLTGIQTDGDLFTAQTQHIVKLQAALLEQREELFELTRQLSALQEAPQALVSALDRQSNPELQILSTQVQALVQQQEARLIFETECKKELVQFGVALAKATDQNEAKQLKTQLEETQNQLQKLKAGPDFKKTLQEFQTDCEQKFENLNGALKSNLTKLQKQVTQDLNHSLQSQGKRVDGLIQNINETLAALEGRVNVLEQWITKAETALAQQQTDKSEAKESVLQMKVLLESFQKDLKKEQEKRQSQELKIIEIQKKIEAVPGAAQVRQVQTEIKLLNTQWSGEERLVQPPSALFKALADKQAELKESQDVLEGAAITPSIRQKLQGAMTQIQEQQAQWAALGESLNFYWQMHNHTQGVALEKLQKINEFCEQRILKLEVDVQQLQLWAKETQARLASMETEESDIQRQLHALQSEMLKWMDQQVKFQSRFELQKKDEAGLLGLQSELKDYGSHNQLLTEIEAVKALYNKGKESLEKAIAKNPGLGTILQSDQEAIREKITLVDEFKKTFQEKQQAVFQKFRDEIQVAIQTLQKQVTELDSKVVTFGRRLDVSEPRYTLAARLNTLRQKVLEDKYITSELDYYIAPNGQLLPGSMSTTPLLKWVLDNFLNAPAQILLLQGPGGIGKSTFNRFLLRYLWQMPAWEKFQPGDAPPKELVPLFVPLGSSRINPGRLLDYLRDMPELTEGFTDAEINILKSEYQLLWIADGYDEMPGRIKLNLYEQNRIEEYQGRVKLLVSYRTDDSVPRVNEKLYFIPRLHTPARPLYQSYYVAPFTRDQMRDYIDQYLLKKRQEMLRLNEPLDLLWKDSGAYLDYFRQISDFESLVSIPFLLMITVEILPKIVAKIESEQISENRARPGIRKLKLQKKRLLGEFVDSWFARQAQKALPKAEEFFSDIHLACGPDVVEDLDKKSQPEDFKANLLKSGYRKFCKDLANHMQKDQLSVVQYPSKEEKSSTWIKKMFDPNNHDMSVSRRGSPLKIRDLGRGQTEYSFIHMLLIDYFAAEVTLEIDDIEEKSTTQNSKGAKTGSGGVLSSMSLASNFGAANPNVTSAFILPTLLPANPVQPQALSSNFGQTVMGENAAGKPKISTPSTEVIKSTHSEPGALLMQVRDLLDQVYPPNDLRYENERSPYLLQLEDFRRSQNNLSASDRAMLTGMHSDLLRIKQTTVVSSPKK